MKHLDPGFDDTPLPGADEVRQAYRELPNSAVPAELDARVLARAREAATQHNNVVVMKRAAIRRWAIPLTTAASVLVATSVTYETQFSVPRNASVATTIVNAERIIEVNPVVAPASPAPETTGAVAEKPVPPQARKMADAAREESMPPPPAIAPSIGLPVASSPVESTTLASPASGITVPSPSAAPTQQDMMANESRKAYMEVDTTKPESQEPVGKRQDQQAQSKAPEQTKVAAATASVPMQGQVSGIVARRADAMTSPGALSRLVGHYKYEAYKVTQPSNKVLGLKELGYATATWDIDAEGTLTQRMTMSDGEVVTQIAKIVEVKLDGSVGYWIAQWPEISYPVHSDISLDKGGLSIKTQFDELADTPRFGSVELVRLKRVGL